MAKTWKSKIVDVQLTKAFNKALRQNVPRKQGGYGRPR